MTELRPYLDALIDAVLALATGVAAGIIALWMTGIIS